MTQCGNWLGHLRPPPHRCGNATDAGWTLGCLLASCHSCLLSPSLLPSSLTGTWSRTCGSSSFRGCGNLSKHSIWRNDLLLRNFKWQQRWLILIQPLGEPEDLNQAYCQVGFQIQGICFGALVHLKLTCRTFPTDTTILGHHWCIWMPNKCVTVC